MWATDTLRELVTGNGIHQVLGPFGIATLVVVAAVAALAFVLLRRREQVWQHEADRAGRDRRGGRG